MKVVKIEKFGGPEVLELKDISIGKPKDDINNVPNDAPIILAVVNFVLSSLSEVIRGVKEE